MLKMHEEMLELLHLLRPDSSTKEEWEAVLSMERAARELLGAISWFQDHKAKYDN